MHSIRNYRQHNENNYSAAVKSLLVAVLLENSSSTAAMSLQGLM